MNLGKGSDWYFRLYIAGDSPNSRQAFVNMLALCEDFLIAENQVEVIDVLEHPNRIFEDNIIVTPTLIKVAPEPRCILMGNLSDRKRVLQSLGLDRQEGIEIGKRED